MTKKQFNKLWECSTRDEILNQYYYDYKKMVILNNIIKEVREYVKEHIRIDDEYPDYMEMLIEEYDKLLEILDKVEKENDIEFDVLKALNTDLNDLLHQLEADTIKNIQVGNNRGFNLISSIDEVKTLDDFTLNEYIGYLVSLQLYDKLQEFNKGGTTTPPKGVMCDKMP